MSSYRQPSSGGPPLLPPLFLKARVIPKKENPGLRGFDDWGIPRVILHYLYDLWSWFCLNLSDPEHVTKISVTAWNIKPGKILILNDLCFDKWWSQHLKSLFSDFIITPELLKNLSFNFNSSFPAYFVAAVTMNTTCLVHQNFVYFFIIKTQSPDRTNINTFWAADA